MITKLKRVVDSFLKSDKQFPVITAIASGLYPMLYCYSKNFSIVNSLDHFLFFIVAFLCIPIVVFKLVHWVSKFNSLKKYDKYILPFFNIFTFLFLIKTIAYAGFDKKKTLLVILISIIFAVFFNKYLKKIVVFQYLLAFVSAISLTFIISKNLRISNEWQVQPDDIVKVEFKIKPNIYFIQPDGYVNFSEIKKGFYDFDNSEFESFLHRNDFVTYPDFRSNYTTTLSSNASTFMMKHHYYNNLVSSFEMYNARDMIISKNPVLDVFKNNGYKTYFLSETPYMMFNRPKIGYDFTNIDYTNIPFINPGISNPVDINMSLKASISEEIDSPKFFFLQILKPWHISSRKSINSDKALERKLWLENLVEANNALSKMINLIKERDKNALIIIMADHGGYVGMDFGDQSEKKSQDRDFIYSIFSSQLSIHWPKNDVPNYGHKFKSSVNLFRILFSYLSENEKYLSNLQPDESYIVIKEGTPKGVYKYIDKDGAIVFKKHTTD